MNIDYNGDTFTFDIPDHYKKIGVSLSGGADSSILLYMLIDYIEKNNLDKEILIMSRANKFDKYKDHLSATNVVDYMLKLTDKIKSHQVFYYDMQVPEQAIELFTSFTLKGEMDLALNGITSIPLTPAKVKNTKGELIDIIETASPRSKAERSPTARLKPTFWQGKKYHEYRPFLNMDKKFIAFLYDFYSVPELFPLTRSCDHDYWRSTEDNHCGNCWWCLERKWAFGKL